jgi:hypothetical protein
MQARTVVGKGSPPHDDHVRPGQVGRPRRGRVRRPPARPAQFDLALPAQRGRGAHHGPQRGRSGRRPRGDPGRVFGQRSRASIAGKYRGQVSRGRSARRGHPDRSTNNSAASVRRRFSADWKTAIADAVHDVAQRRRNRSAGRTQTRASAFEPAHVRNEQSSTRTKPRSVARVADRSAR